MKLASWVTYRTGFARLAAWLARRHLLLETDVAREIEWLIATELLEIPFHRHDRASDRDAIAEAILADDRAAQRLAAPLADLGGRDPELRCRRAAVIESYLGSRAAIAEITTASSIAIATPGSNQ